MKHIFELFIIAAFLIFLLAAPGYAQNNIRIAVYGSGLMSGYQLQPREAYPARLDYRLREMGYTNVEVINESRPEQTSTTALDNIQSLLAKRPDIVILELASNDALKGISTNIIYGNLGNIIRILQQYRIGIILMGIKMPAGTDAEYDRQLQAAFQGLAKFYRVEYYPNLLEGIQENADLSLADGYYPNGKGIDRMVENTLRTVDYTLRIKWNSLYSGQDDTSASGQAMPPSMPVTVDPQALPPSRNQ